MSNAHTSTGLQNSYKYHINYIYSTINNNCFVLNSLPTRGEFCCLLITFANSLDPDQARQNVGPDLDPNCLILRWY